jgi:ATP-dependent RNA helicase RhlE
VNLLKYLLRDSSEFKKVLVFVSSKKSADLLFRSIEDELGTETSIVHSNKSQNYRIRSIQQFDEGQNRILITTDVMARGLDLNMISHVINFDTPSFPENYMHRIGRTGRAEQQGKSLLLYTDLEKPDKERIEALMNFTIPNSLLPEEVEISNELIPDERPDNPEIILKRKTDTEQKKGAFHEKKAKNLKTNQGGSYLRKKKNYKKPKTKGDKNFNRRKKN